MAVVSCFPDYCAAWLRNVVSHVRFRWRLVSSLWKQAVGFEECSYDCPLIWFAHSESLRTFFWPLVLELYERDRGAACSQTETPLYPPKETVFVFFFGSMPDPLWHSASPGEWILDRVLTTALQWTNGAFNSSYCVTIFIHYLNGYWFQSEKVLNNGLACIKNSR